MAWETQRAPGTSSSHCRSRPGRGVSTFHRVGLRASVPAFSPDVEKGAPSRWRLRGPRGGTVRPPEPKLASKLYGEECLAADQNCHRSIRASRPLRVTETSESRRYPY